MGSFGPRASQGIPHLTLSQRLAELGEGVPTREGVTEEEKGTHG